MPAELTFLSESVDGRPILIDHSVAPGRLIHKAPIGFTSIDRVFLYAANPQGTALQLCIAWGGTATEFRLVNFAAINSGAIDVVFAKGLPAQDGLEIRGISVGGSSGVGFTVVGYVIRMTGGQ